MELLLTLGTAAGLFILFAVLEAALNRGMPAESTRRLAHVVGAGAAATFPFYLQLRDVLLVAAVFTVFLASTQFQGDLRR